MLGAAKAEPDVPKTVKACLQSLWAYLLGVSVAGSTPLSVLRQVDGSPIPEEEHSDPSGYVVFPWRLGIR